VAAIVAALKLAVVAADTTIRLYLGDSAAYLHGARDNGRLPDDRSFVYSLLIRGLVTPFEDLRWLLLWQTLAGIAIALLLYHLLARRFAVPHRVALVASGVLAIEPAQVFYERMILAETVGLLAFAACIAAASAYLTSGRPRWLPLTALLGLLAAALRLNYLAVVIVLALLLPVVRAIGPSRAARTIVVHAVIAVASVVALHTAYRHAVSVIFDVPPSYLGRAGFMQLGLVTPLVRPEHFARVGLPADFATQLQYPLANPDARMRHMWTPGGLVRELARRQLPVESIARDLSSMAVADDPLGLLRLGIHTMGGYFRLSGIEHALHNDLGRREIPYDVIWSLREEWNYDARGLHARVTPVSRYFELGAPWLVGALLLLPVFSVANVVAHWSTARREQALLAGLAGMGLFLAHLLFVNVAFYRYLHPVPCVLLLNAVPIVMRTAGTADAVPSAARPH
jgi:hypothetical protein